MEKLKQCCDQRLRDSSFERDRAYGFSWPQRRYRCSFCSKEFMSAQALGGHMNVHRRDRARMRLYPSWDSPNTPNPSPNPNPNPNPNPSLPSTSRFSSFSDVINSSPSLQEDGVDRSLPHNITALLGEDIGKQNEAGEVLEFTHFTTKNGARVPKPKEFVRLDLNLGSLIQDAKEDSDLDLELRL